MAVSGRRDDLLTDVPTLDAVLRAHASQLGVDFDGYRNHTYRVANFCLTLSTERADRVEKVAVAAAFHDLGIWTHGTFDYLQPSVSLAHAYLRESGGGRWAAEIEAMIVEHHKISTYRHDPHSLVESFRRADWVDVSRGLVTFGLPRGLVREVFARWPSAGFHKRLIQLAFSRLRSHPLSPLPMLRL